MTISYNWLSTYFHQIPGPDEIANILTSVGLEVESMEKLEAVRGGLDGLFIAKISSYMPHPDADKLTLTKVDIGSGTDLQIVCGAPNVAAGQTVVVAPVGTTIYPTTGTPLTMKKAKIRGVESQGMICAEDEIGLGNSHDGIIVIDKDIAPGTPARDFYNLSAPDYIYEIGLTPNRMDSMSHIGVAKDICAYLSNIQHKPVALKMPAIQLPARSGQSQIEIEVAIPEICARYAGICIDGIRVADSPQWLQTHLKSIGLRPLNNIVDITNFVLHECGQPLHAFDRKAISGNKIVVRTAKADETFITLDEKERKLSSEDIMICNEKEAMCIAGVFGGLHSGVQPDTTAVFIESAWFNPTHIRRTSMRLGLRTDAAIRFEKGVDISNTIYAVQRAAAMILEIAGGQISSALIDHYPVEMQQLHIEVSYSGINALAGKDYSKAQVKNILTSLCFNIVHEDGDKLKVTVPFAKNHIRLQADIVEEIMRIDGLDNIPFTGKIQYSIPASLAAHSEDLKKKFSQHLCGKGFFEIFTNSITNSAYYPNQANLVKMMNSLSANLDTMRPSMLESGLEAISYNLNRKSNQIKFFEFGKIYLRQDAKFVETEMLCLFASGNKIKANWIEKEKPGDFFDLKGIIESILGSMNFQFQPDEDQLNIIFQKRNIGRLMRVEAHKLKQFEIKQEVYFAELNWTEIKSHHVSRKIRFKEIPRFPIMERDLALILDKQIQYLDIQKNIRQTQSKLLQEVSVFDVFESEKLGAGKKSYAINLTFYNDEKTLTDLEVETEMNKIIQNLETKLGALIRRN